MEVLAAKTPAASAVSWGRWELGSMRREPCCNSEASSAIQEIALETYLVHLKCFMRHRAGMEA